MDYADKNEKLISHLVAEGILQDKRLIKAFRSVPRHYFVPDEYLLEAYGDYALPTMCGQTISQPYTVVVMLEALKLKKGDNVLEIGTGSGWTACLIASVIGSKGRVTTIELFPRLVEFAKKNIKNVKLKNIEVICGDGKLGYPENAPYDCSLINAACKEIPKPIIEQIKVGGRIVAPVENSFGEQTMIVAEKFSEKQLKKTNLGAFIFVPLR